MRISPINGNRGERIIMKNRSKRYKEIFKNTVNDKKISLKDALDLVKKNSTTKFDES